MERHQITGHTELIGLMAYPIRHSQSPATHNAAYEKLGVDIVNLAFEVDADDLEDAIKGLRALKLRGSNISMPNKTIVHKYLDEVSPAAQLCGAVNTIVNKDGYLIGHNTDGIGYVQSLEGQRHRSHRQKGDHRRIRRGGHCRTDPVRPGRRGRDVHLRKR